VETLSRILVLCSCAIFLLASCSANIGGDSSNVQAPLESLSCIAVLPAGTSADKEETISYDDARSLETGATYATSIMARELEGNPKVRILGSSQVAPEISGGLSGMVSAIGKKVSCQGVLLTTVRRFKQRVGTEYATDDPASVDLNMVLIHTESGAVLWTADFRETQESFFDNILSFDKMQRRGFKWITVEQLMEQGITERLTACPYLK
jgi:hypothetical protein